MRLHALFTQACGNNDLGEYALLFTDVMETLSDLVYPDGYRHDQALDRFRLRVKKARPFIFDEQAVAMAANVSQSKPSSILASLPFVRLPAPYMWIEFSNQHLRQAMHDLGSPNIRSERAVVDVERTAFLLWEDDGRIMMEYVHRDRAGDKTYTDLAPIVGMFDPSLDNKFAKFSAFIATKASPMKEIETYGATGKVAQALKELRDPDQQMAKNELSARFSYSSHPDMERLRQSIRLIMTHDQIRQVELNQMEDMHWMFSGFVLPALILLNCRNAVDREVVEAPFKLNKQRAKKGKPLIEGYEFVKLHLSDATKRVYRRLGMSVQSRSGGLVIGHFKVRKNGVWWWSPHWRGSSSTGRDKGYIVTP